MSGHQMCTPKGTLTTTRMDPKKQRSMLWVPLEPGLSMAQCWGWDLT